MQFYELHEIRGRKNCVILLISNVSFSNTFGSFSRARKSRFSGGGVSQCLSIDDYIKGQYWCCSNAICLNSGSSQSYACKSELNGDDVIVCPKIVECIRGHHSRYSITTALLS